MPRGHPSHTTTTTALASNYVPPPTPSTSFNTEPPSSLSPFEESDEEPDLNVEVTDILAEQQIQVQGRRSGHKEGRAEKSVDGYASAKQEFIRFCKVSGEGGKTYFRGVLVPNDKKTWNYPYVTLNTVVYFLSKIYQVGYQYNRKRKPWTLRKYKPENRTWFEDCLASQSSSCDDRNCVNDIPITWSGSGDHMLKALKDLKAEQLATEAGQRFYNDQKYPNRSHPIRCKSKDVPEFKVIKDIMEARLVKYRKNSDYDYFKGSLTDGYGPDMHKNLVKNFLKIGGYTGALYALIQGHCYQECMRCEGVLELCLTNMGAYYCSDPSAIGAVGEYLEVKATVVGVDPKSNKPEVICSMRGKDPLTCIFFLTGHYFFYRYLLHNDCTPTGLMPQQRRTGNENDGNLSGK